MGFQPIKDKFVETERLTEEMVDNKTGDPILSWKEKIFLVGKWQTRKYYTQEDFDSKTIQNKLYEPNSYWWLGFIANAR